LVISDKYSTMNYNWNIIGDKIFGILRGRGYHLKMFDDGGQRTMDPHEATRFFATVPSHSPELNSFDILVSLHDDDASSHMDIKTPPLDNTDDFDTIVKLKNSLQTNIGDNEGLSVNWYKFAHDIDVRDDEVNNIQESRDISKPYGSTKSSYQMVGNSKLIIRHTDPVNEEKQGSRWRHIKNIFIETKLGERFNYPHAHIAGARAMARHLANEGKFNDPVAKNILRMSEDYLELKRANRMMRNKDNDHSIKVRGALSTLAKDSKRLSGSKGYAKGVQQIAHKTMLADIHEVLELRDALAEACGCVQQDAVGMKALETAARYIVANKDRAPEIVEDDILRLEELAGIID
jgi:hypothetical protein